MEPRLYFDLKPGMQIKFGNSSRLFILNGVDVLEQEQKEQEAKDKEKEIDRERKEQEDLAKKEAKKRKKDELSSFVGTVEDGEKLIKKKEHEQRRKEMQKQKAKKHDKEKKKKQNMEIGLDYFDEEEEEEEKKDEKKDEDDDSNNEGEAPDPDKIIVGAARDNWDEYDQDNENDEFFDRTSKSSSSAPNVSKKSLTREQIINARVELDLQIKNLQEKILAESAELKKQNNEEDELDAYMNQVANTNKADKLKKMEQRKLELEKEDKRLARLQEITSTTLDRIGNEQKKDKLEDRVKSFVVPAEVKGSTKKRIIEDDLEVQELKSDVDNNSEKNDEKSVSNNKRSKTIESSTTSVIAEFVQREKKRKSANNQDQKKSSVPVSRDPDEDMEVIFLYSKK